jgi:hypothetical protein
MGDADSEIRPPAEPRRLLQRARLPLVSGRASAGILLLCLGVTALWVLPLAKRFSAWVDVEIVLGLWWAVWTITLVYLLYTGRRLSDDHAMAAPRNWFGKGSSSSSGWLDLFSVPLEGCAVEGCATVMAVIAVIFLALFGLWLLIEVLIPTIAFVMYFLLRGMLAKVANDEHGCEGNPLRAAGWGALWATVYIAPLAVLVWFVHLLHRAATGA